MTCQQIKLIEKFSTAQNYLDMHAEEYPLWKVEAIENKINCLIRLMETSDRRDCSKIF